VAGNGILLCFLTRPLNKQEEGGGELLQDQCDNFRVDIVPFFRSSYFKCFRCDGERGEEEDGWQRNRAYRMELRLIALFYRLNMLPFAVQPGGGGEGDSLEKEKKEVGGGRPWILEGSEKKKKKQKKTLFFLPITPRTGSSWKKERESPARRLIIRPNAESTFPCSPSFFSVDRGARPIGVHVAKKKGRKGGGFRRDRWHAAFPSILTSPLCLRSFLRRGEGRDL